MPSCWRHCSSLTGGVYCDIWQPACRNLKLFYNNNLSAFRHMRMLSQPSGGKRRECVTRKSVWRLRGFDGFGDDGGRGDAFGLADGGGGHGGGFDGAGREHFVGPLGRFDHAHVAPFAL